MRHASDGLLDYLDAQAEEEAADALGPPRGLLQLCDALLAVWRRHARNTRVILPLLKTLNVLFSNGCFDILMDAADEGGAFAAAAVALAKVSTRAAGLQFYWR